MSRDPRDRFDDILEAIDRCLGYRIYLTDQDTALSSMAYDAVLRNLAVIGEAVRSLSDEDKAFARDIPWASIAGLRNIVVHEYFRIDPELIRDILDNELVPLVAAIRRQVRE